MTYGVDQCRVCGKAIKISGPHAMAQYLETQALRRPNMTEKQWRAAGLKTAPTLLQMRRQSDGCCFECQFPTRYREVRAWRFILPMFGGAIALFLFIYLVVSVFT